MRSFRELVGQLIGVPSHRAAYDELAARVSRLEADMVAFITAVERLRAAIERDLVERRGLDK